MAISLILDLAMATLFFSKATTAGNIEDKAMAEDWTEIANVGLVGRLD